MSLTKATYSMIKGACVNVLDFGENTTPRGAQAYEAMKQDDRFSGATDC